MLAITSGGNKLPPLIVFYGVPNGPKEKELKNHQLALQKKLYIYCQKDGWANREIFKYWYENILFKYKPESNENANKILIIERATSHSENELVNIFKDNNSKYILIPPGIKRFCQPLDISINAPVKAAIKKWDTLFRISNNNTRKPTNKELLEAIYNIWYDENIISKKMIYHSFKITGISINMDGSENHLVHINENLITKIPVPNDIIDKEDEDKKIKLENKHSYIKGNLANKSSGNYKIEKFFKIQKEDLMDID